LKIVAFVHAGMFASVDTDSSSSISNLEFATYSISSTASGTMSWTFNKYDSNNDQKWSPAEFTNYLSFSGGNCEFTILDSNLDSFVSQLEYTEYHQNGCAVPSSGYNCEQVFDLFDTSADNSWSAGYVWSVVPVDKVLVHIQEREFAFLILGADSNIVHIQAREFAFLILGADLIPLGADLIPLKHPIPRPS